MTGIPVGLLISSLISWFCLEFHISRSNFRTLVLNLMRIIHHCACCEGGLAEYSFYQSAAIAGFINNEILWHALLTLSVPNNTIPITSLPYPTRIHHPGMVQRVLGFAHSALVAQQSLVTEIARYRPGAVLLYNWRENFSPFLTWNLRRWRDHVYVLEPSRLRQASFSRIRPNPNRRLP